MWSFRAKASRQLQRKRQPGAQPPPEPALQVERRFIKAGEVRGDRVSVPQGLKEGEQVVTVGQLKLRPGTNIRIDNSVALNKPAGTGTE